MDLPALVFSGGWQPVSTGPAKPCWALTESFYGTLVSNMHRIALGGHFVGLLLSLPAQRSSFWSACHLMTFYARSSSPTVTASLLLSVSRQSWDTAESVVIIWMWQPECSRFHHVTMRTFTDILPVETRTLVKSKLEERWSVATTCKTIYIFGDLMSLYSDKSADYIYLFQTQNWINFCRTSWKGLFWHLFFTLLLFINQLL